MAALYRTNSMTVMPASATSLSASWAIEVSTDNGSTWEEFDRLSFSAEATTPIEKLREMVDRMSAERTLADRIVRDLSVVAAIFYNGREIALP